MTGSEVERNMKHNEPKGSKAFRWMITGILILTAVVLMLPLYYLVVTSFKTMQEAIGPFHWRPQTRTLDNFREVLQICLLYTSLMRHSHAPTYYIESCCPVDNPYESSR